MPHNLNRALNSVLLSSLLFVVGCNDGLPTRVPVSGRVLIDGQPLKCGFVRFVPADARASMGTLDADGRFKLYCFKPDDGAVLGLHRVEVSGRERIREGELRWHAPTKYASFQTSGLTQEITGPTDSVLIELSWEGGKPFLEIDESAAGGDDQGIAGRPKPKH